MYRILKSEKDTYITNKVIAGERSTTSNVGNAGTLDLYKLYNESTALSGTSDLTEISRILIKFNLESLQQLTGSILDVSNSNFKCFLNLKNIYGGQTTPSQFNIFVYPLAKEFDEGRGMDVVAYRDIDVANWITASIDSTSTPVLWYVTGAYSSGSIGDSVDYYVSGNIGAGSQSLGYYQFFETGTEDLNIDISPLVSASLFANLPNYGYRISFSAQEENDQYTRFVKRFGSRHTNDKTLHPKLIVKWDGDVISDDSTLALFDQTNRIYIYNDPRSTLTNFVSNSQQITGSNCLIYEIFASRSITYYTTSFSQTHSQSISHKTSSYIYFSASFSGSQLAFGNINQTGIYYADITFNQNDSYLNDYIDDIGYQATFQSVWKSLDRTLLYTSGSQIKINKHSGAGTSFDLKNYVVNILNLKEIYSNAEKSKLRVFIQDYNFEVFALRLPRPSKSRIFKNMYWRLIDPYSKKVIIPYDDIGTKLSSDGDGMFFDFWFEDLDPSCVYEFEFKIVEDNNVHYINNQGFIFKVIR